MPGSSSARSVASLVLIGGMAWGLGGCPPTCQSLCNKLDRCDLEPTLSRSECQTSCERELEVRRDDDEDRELLQAFNRHRICLGNNSCDEIAAGACFDEELFPIAPE